MVVYKITISKSVVLDEVGKTTAYLGSKSMSDNDPGAYERIATTSANREQLERYWVEACTAADAALSRWLQPGPSQQIGHHCDLTNDYDVTLYLSNSWESSLGDSARASLVDFFIDFIVSKWLLLVSREDAATYAALSASMLKDVIDKFYRKVVPTRRGPRPLFGDINQDGELTVADVNLLTEILFSKPSSGSGGGDQ